MTKVRENLSIFAAAAITLALLVIADHYGLPHKWQTAIFGTVVPFTVVVLWCPLRWRRWSFWASISICLAIHTLAIWGLFEYVILGVAPGWLLWTPIASVEAFALLVVVTRFEKKLTGKGKATRLSERA
jgi:hypothetical protein